MLLLLLLLLLLLMMMMMMMMMWRCRYSGETTEAAEGRCWRSLHVERLEHRRECHSVRQSLPFLRL